MGVQPRATRPFYQNGSKPALNRILKYVVTHEVVVTAADELVGALGSTKAEDRDGGASETASKRHNRQRGSTTLAERTLGR